MQPFRPEFAGYGNLPIMKSGIKAIDIEALVIGFLYIIGCWEEVEENRHKKRSLVTLAFQLVITPL